MSADENGVGMIPGEAQLLKIVASGVGGVAAGACEGLDGGEGGLSPTKVRNPP